MLSGSTKTATDLVGTLKASFEQALAETLQRLLSHRDLVAYAMRSGHRTRPVGCLLSAAAVGGEWQSALDVAIAVELIHKSSVIRDDIVDGDSRRSGQPALHSVLGVSKAICVSDLLWTFALIHISRLSGEIGRQDELALCTHSLHEMAVGQLEDVAPSYERRSVEQRQLAEERKTGVLSELACRLGGIAGGGSTLEVEALARYGRKLGTAFQIINDIRNLCGDELERMPASDLRKRRDTILSAYARETGGDLLRTKIESFMFGSDEPIDSEVEVIKQMILSCDAVGFGERTATHLMEEARRHLVRLQASPAREVLEALTEDALLTYAF